MTQSNQLGFATRCVHAGQAPDPTTGAVMMPIYTTSTYVQQSPGVHKGYDYARTKNPTRMAFERCIADLEGGHAAFAFASGLAAIATTLECLDAGSHIVAVDDLYGGSRRLFERVRRRSAGARHHLSRSHRPRRARGGDPPEYAADLDRDADQSAAQAGRSRSGRRAREGARHLGRCRQHLRQPLCPAPARSRLRPRGAFHHQISQRPFRHGGRRRRGRRERRAARAPGLPAERGRRDPGPVRFLPGAARAQDARAAHGAPLRLGACDRAMAGAPSQGAPRLLSRACEPSPARAGEAADARLRRHDLGRACRAASTTRGAFSSAAGCSRWPKAWAASKASSSIPR